MSGKTLVDQIRHYQKDIERCPENSERMIRCIQRLYVLPIQVLHLQETGVGRSVNSLRKYKGEVGEAAKALVAKWKAMVAAEESGDDCNENIKTKEEENRLSKSSVSSVKIESRPEKPVVKYDKPIVKSEKLEHSVIKDKSSVKEKFSSKEKSSSRDRSIVQEKPPVKSYHSSTKYNDSHSSSKSHSSSLKRSHSNSEKSSSEKQSFSHRSHKSSHEERKNDSDDDDPPDSKKHRKHHSHSRNHLHSKRDMESDDEEEAELSQEELMDTDRSEANDSNSDSGKESSEDSENSSAEDEPVTEHFEEENDDKDSDSSSDHRHRSKHKSSHHKHIRSSHSHSDKNKENYNSDKSSSRHSDKKSLKDSKSSSKNIEELIKENEKKIKKEKVEFEVPKYVPTKIVKLERNEDGSIDSGSGASFGDALLGMDNFVEPKKKKKSSKESSSSTNHKTSSSQRSSSSNNHKKSHHSYSSSSSSSSSKSKLKDSSSSSKTIGELVETPELLTKKVKLETLDLDISSTLPEINPNYKPLPHIPETSRRPKNTMSEEDTMFSIMTTKNLRTKVYSGNKVYQNSVPSLYSLCIQLLYENIDAVEYTGGVPYELLKPLLEKLNSDQLYVIEHFNPYLIEDTDQLWKFHCNKDFRSEKRQVMESWRELYLRCLEERERKLKALTANISQSMAKSTPVRQAKLAYVDSVVKPPRNVARKQAKYGTGNSGGSKSPSKSNKQDIVNKAVVGGHTPGVSAKDVVPPPPASRSSIHHSTPTVLKKKKAPLMQKALQFIKGNRYKR